MSVPHLSEGHGGSDESNSDIISRAQPPIPFVALSVVFYTHTLFLCPLLSCGPPCCAFGAFQLLSGSHRQFKIRKIHIWAADG